MDSFDEAIRSALIEACRSKGIDVRALSIDVGIGALTIRGTLPTEEQRRGLWSILETVDRRVGDIDCKVGVAAAVPEVATMPVPPQPGAPAGEIR
ncbi:hypothetical protein [Reyranella massiliensis]|uniref:hypothetical protein n=1 Tax=Reyranella massiliensis TaxID=445220 RepID=UPI00030AFFAF|nr:hypothetical protein [Reyranella massiliensis]